MTLITARRLLGTMACTVLGVAAACGGKTEGTKVPLAQATAQPSASPAAAAPTQALGPDAQKALDSGNVLFRKKDYKAALVQYQLANQRAPEHAAPYFGIYMVARAMNDTALASRTLAEIRKRNAGPPHDFTDSAFKDVHKGVKMGATKG